MKRTARLGAITAVAALGFTGVGLAAPASADPTAKTVPCPNNATTVQGELGYAERKAHHVTTYLTYSPGKMVHDIYRFDTPSGGHFEEFASDGARLGRQCFDKMPEREHNFGPAEWEFISGSSGRGGSSTGYYAHTPGVHMIATTKWVKWKVSVN